MEQEKKNNLLNLSYEELKSELYNLSIGQISQKYDIKRNILLSRIYGNSELKMIYKKAKYKRLHPDSRELFKSELTDSGCNLLAEAVIKLAVKDCDVYFFESGFFEFYQDFTKHKKTAEYYIGHMHR